MKSRDPSAIVALGSNLGDSRTIVLQAMDRLEELSSEPLLRSSLWRSAPVDCPSGAPDFINAVVGLTPHPGETPETLLDKLKALECEFGRQPKRVPNDSRPLDLDLISFRAEQRSTERLTLPHPRSHLRSFVLKPLAEIAPGLVLPGQTMSVAEQLRQLPPDSMAKVLARDPDHGLPG